MAKNILTLAKELDFNSKDEYFDYLRDSYLNGNFSQCKRLFAEMKKEDRKEAVKYLKPSKGNEETADQEVYEYFIELL